MRGPTSDESSAYLTGGIEFTTGKSPSSSDGIPWSAICRSLRFEQGQDSLSTVCCPRCDLAAVGFTQRLWGRHVSSLPHRPVTSCQGPATVAPRHIHRETFAKRPGVEFEEVVVVIVEVDGLSLALDT